MQVTILGSGTSVPRPRRAPSGVLVQEGDTSLLLDGGPGTLTRMAEAGVLLEDLDRAMYTHLHLDHTGDLPATLFALRNPDLHRTRPLDLHGPPGLAGLLQRLRAAWGRGAEAAACGVRVHAWNEAEATVFDGWRVEARRVRHGGQAHGLRVTSPTGRVLCYPGDTDVCDAVVDLARGADLLLLECSHPDERKVAGHLSPTPCGELAARAGARRLMLTHFYPGWNPSEAVAVAARGYAGPIELAHDGLRVTP